MTRRGRGQTTVVAGLGFVCLLALAVAPARGARLPDWAEAIAGAAPEVGSEVHEDAWLVLLHEVTRVVRADGTLAIHQRIARQARTAKVEVDMEGLLFHERRKMERARAWHLPPGESRAKKKGGRSVIDLAASRDLTDSKIRMVRVDDVERGSLVFFEFEAVEDPLVYSFLEPVPGDHDTTLARIVYRLPTGWTLRWRWLNGAGPEPVTVGTVWTWELEGLPRIEAESFADPVFVRSPRLLVGLQPPPGAEIPGAVLPDWSSFSAWYEELAKGRSDPTEAVVAAAAECMGPPDADFVTRVEGAASWVRDSVRYVAKHVGIGALRPRPAAETCETRYGDCKDKSTLLAALLASQDILSYPVLVHGSAAQTVDEEIPSISAFNHMILAVAVPEGVALPERFALATAEVNDLGRLLFLDTTQEHTAIGALPSALAGQRALVAAGSAGRLVTLPGQVSGANRVELEVETSVESSGKARFIVTARLHGGPSEMARALHRVEMDARELYWREIVADDWPGSTFAEHEVISEDDAGAFVERVEFELEQPGESPLSVFPRASHWLAKANVRKRGEVPIVYAYPGEIHLEARVSGVPAGTILWEPVGRTIDGLSIEASMSREGENVSATGSLTLSKTRFEPAEFRSLRKAYATLGSLDRFAIRLP